jgi:hypothetical protein
MVDLVVWFVGLRGWGLRREEIDFFMNLLDEGGFVLALAELSC